MTKHERDGLKGRELAVWSAAYSAEYARSFHEGVLRMCPAADVGAALRVADRAVESLRFVEAV